MGGYSSELAGDERVDMDGHEWCIYITKVTKSKYAGTDGIPFAYLMPFGKSRRGGVCMYTSLASPQEFATSTGSLEDEDSITNQMAWATTKLRQSGALRVLGDPPSRRFRRRWGGAG